MRIESAPISPGLPPDRWMPAEALPASGIGEGGKVVLISDHDYRTPRRANMHPIADALVRLGYDVTFVSVRYSRLSMLKGDSRNFLHDNANAPELVNNVRCYLWKTPVHPINLRHSFLNALSAPLYKLYARLPCAFLDEELKVANHVIVESGLGAVLVRRARALNHSVKISYLASDELVTVGVHPCVQAELEAAARAINFACVPSRRMAESFDWVGERVFYVPHGIEHSDFAAIGESPYEAGDHAVSVGSMLFDPGFFAIAAARFPKVRFHVIGAGQRFEAPENVIQHTEMPFRETLPYIRHATLGIAPYRHAAGCEYISDTSMKLMQYEYLGIPAVCPTFAAADHPGRFGYRPDDQQSIIDAIERALAQRRAVRPRRFLSWDDVARRLLNPRAFADTVL